MWTRQTSSGLQIHDYVELDIVVGIHFGTLYSMLHLWIASYCQTTKRFVGSAWIYRKLCLKEVSGYNQSAYKHYALVQIQKYNTTNLYQDYHNDIAQFVQILQVGKQKRQVLDNISGNCRSIDAQKRRKTTFGCIKCGIPTCKDNGCFTKHCNTTNILWKLWITSFLGFCTWLFILVDAN